MPANYGILEDEEYNTAHKRQRLTIWSGPFASVYEADAFSLPKNAGFMLQLYGSYFEAPVKIRVACPAPRTDDNWAEVDAAIKDALHRQAGCVPINELQAGDIFAWHYQEVPCTYLGCSDRVYRWRAYDGEHSGMTGRYIGTGKTAWPFVHLLPQVCPDEAAQTQETTARRLAEADAQHRQEA